MSTLVNPKIIRAYDVRGIYSDDLRDIDARSLGFSLANLIKRNNGIAVIGRDGRISSPKLANELASALIESGITVINLGVVATPMCYFSSKMVAADIAVMVTGSHNPYQHNGFKILVNNAPLFGDSLKNALSKPYTKFATKGSHLTLNCSQAYLSKVVGKSPKSAEKMKICWDPGNGAVSLILPELLKRLNGKKAKVLNGAIDGFFPNRSPDPTAEGNLSQMSSVIKKDDFNVGFAFDGDGDRLVVLDEKGNTLRGDELLTLLSESLLREKPHAKIIADVKCGRAFFERITQLGGKVLMSATGHALIKSALVEHKGDLAGELSGHFFFKHNYYGFDDAIYAACRVIEIIDGMDLTLSEWRDSLPKYTSTPELRFDLKEENKEDFMLRILSYLKSQDKGYIDIDGVRVESKNGWWGIRLSNTEQKITMRAEGTNKETLKAQVDDLYKALNTCGFNIGKENLLA